MRTKTFLILFLYVTCSLALLMGQTHDILEEFMPADTAENLLTHLNNVHNKVSRSSIEKMLSTLTEEPHRAGTRGASIEAQKIESYFSQFGLKTLIHTYTVPISTAQTIELQLLIPEKKILNLTPKGEPTDKDSFDNRDIPYLAYSASGDVTGQLVYANYGTRSDFKWLRKNNIPLKNAIVLIRYGKVFRGVKVRLAEQYGAKGVILFSDPENDGYHRGDPYPFGPWRPLWAVQRGSILEMMIYPGDPTTPEFASPYEQTSLVRSQQKVKFPWKPDKQKPLKPVHIQSAKNMVHIPALPISAENARLLLQAIGGKPAPSSWQGGLPLTYHIGPGPARVRLKVEMNVSPEKLYNVTAWIEGTEDTWMIIGGHHDAWLHGAVDPTSGIAVLLETARILAQSYREKKPARGILFVAWDGEEPGIIGSTEFVESFRSTLMKKAITYVNLDSAVAGIHPSAMASPQLREWMKVSAQLTPFFGEEGTVLDIWLKRQKKNLSDTPDMGLPGSGSDFTAFVCLTGIPVMGLHFGGPYGVYHSSLDTFTWMKRFGDPQFVGHVTATQWLLSLILVGEYSTILPVRTYALAQFLLDELESMNTDMSDIDDDEIMTMYRSLLSKTREWLKTTKTFDKTGSMIAVSGNSRSIKKWNALARTLDEVFLNMDGLPSRPWYKHILYAPDIDLGYGALPLPYLREALNDKNKESLKRAISSLLEKVDLIDTRMKKFLQ